EPEEPASLGVRLDRRELLAYLAGSGPLRDVRAVLGHRTVDAVHARLQELGEKFFLRGEVRVERPAAEAGLRGDRLDAAPEEPPLDEHPCGRVEERLPGLLALLGAGQSGWCGTHIRDCIQ